MSGLFILAAVVAALVGLHSLGLVLYFRSTRVPNDANTWPETRALARLAGVDACALQQLINDLDPERR